MIYLAYDGSVNGDWISHYAVRLAANDGARALRVLHVDDDDAGELDAKFARIAAECRTRGVAADIERMPRRGTVPQSLAAAVPEGPGNLLICGARVRSRDRGYLAGTVSAELLRWRRCDVVALRVVNPGLLGTPKKLLLPLGGSEAGLQNAIPLLRLFWPQVSRLELLRIVEVNSARYRLLSPERARRLRRDGMAELHRAETAIVEAVGRENRIVDTRAVVSDDWPKEILITAGRHKSDLVLLEAARRDLERRYFFGNRLEEMLRDAPCDIAVYRGADL